MSFIMFDLSKEGGRGQVHQRASHLTMQELTLERLTITKITFEI